MERALGQVNMTMNRIFQTITVSIALLFCVQGAQASMNRPVDDFTRFGYTDIGALAPGGSANESEPYGDDYPVAWFEFNLTSAASVELDTLESVVALMIVCSTQYWPFMITTEIC